MSDERGARVDGAVESSIVGVEAVEAEVDNAIEETNEAIGADYTVSKRKGVCFNPSEMSSNISDSEFDELRSLFHIPDFFEIIRPLPHERITSPPEGTIAVYTDAFTCGFRLPIGPDVLELYKATGVSLSQLAPKLYVIIHCFLVIMVCLGEVPSAANFAKLYRTQRSSRSAADGADAGVRNSALESRLYIRFVLFLIVITDNL